VKKILFVLMACVLCVGLVGGAFAYFSDTETSTGNTFTAGTMDLQISKDGGVNWYNDNTMTWSAPTGWAPGDTTTLIVDIKNMGTTGALIGGVGGSNLYNPDGLANVINITELDATEYGYGDWMGAPVSGYWDTVFGDGVAPLTLKEFVNSTFSAKFFEGWPPLTTDYLDPNGSESKRIKITFEFDPDAGNEYQGKTATFDLDFSITDDPTLSGTGSP